MIFNYKYNLNNIAIENLIKYLQNKGWKINNEFPNKKLIVFERNFDEELFTITIPINEGFKDYIPRVNDAIILLRELENRDVNNILEDILNINNIKIKNKKDKLSFRIISELSENGTLPLDYGYNIIDGLKKLILSAIYIEDMPRPYFLKANKNSYESLSKFKLAQTNVGSYVFNIEIDNDECCKLKYDENGNIENILESRKVIKRIQNGINDVIDATQQGKIDKLYEDGYKKGLNANMCDAILNFKYKDYEVKIESTVKWADTLPKPDDILQKVILKNTDFYTMKKLSEKYKETDVKCERLIGRIVTLNNAPNSKRNIIIECTIDKKLKHVKIFLDKEDYEKACEFHKKNQAITIIGEISKEGRTWMLYNYDNFMEYK
ncbi:hypothetical protein EXM98_04310 [Clostridium botulinum]|uniref:hypothetical protein n=1 Tax=Clostridium botulinum TaxID=1491 RepID=UPI0001F84CA9|nr:hypothetical protein [Clostridium botulinum]KEI92671.1 hypothetical protein N491_12770 [Clostridium botulinum B2 275]NFB16261.1 hypothetical protein [Clostridium botulinum]NFB67147.1 hypothetical protein [Clostridium botulinum]NFB96736.1 hypothetical protein [Clostridium botulinum]NFC28789.1 hypothetical protein [Clostridium botulinum]